MGPRSQPTSNGPEARLRVAIDVTPLIGPRTGIGQLVAGLVSELEQPQWAQQVELRRLAITWRGRSGAGAHHLPLPARAAHSAWSRSDLAPVEWWTGTVDVVHGTNYVVPPSRRAARLVSVHDLTAVRFPELCTAETLRFPHMVRRAVHRGAHVHCDSSTVADEVRQWLACPADVVHVVHPGIPGVSGRPAGAPEGGLAATVEPGPSWPAPYVLSMGTEEPRKDLPSLVRAFGQLASAHTDLRLVHVGPPGWGSQAVDAAVAQLPSSVQARVERRGFVDDSTRAQLLAGAAVFAYPSVYEGFGFPPLEAMAQGIPVVATTAGSLPEILGDAATLVLPGDSDALAAAIEALLSDTHLRSQRVLAGTRRAAAYTWQGMAAGMLALYRELTCAS